MSDVETAGLAFIRALTGQTDKLRRHPQQRDQGWWRAFWLALAGHGAEAVRTAPTSAHSTASDYPVENAEALFRTIASAVDAAAIGAAFDNMAAETVSHQRQVIEERLLELNQAFILELDSRKDYPHTSEEDTERNYFAVNRGIRDAYQLERARLREMLDLVKSYERRLGSESPDDD